MYSAALLGGLLLATVAPAALAQTTTSGTVWATPHDSYSSSVGVIGCKINTNRVAYWPASVDCTNFCISLSYEGRSVKLLRIDQSQGAFDVSYDAWNYLYTGYSATDQPTAGGPLAMTFETLDPWECADLIHTDGSKLPLSASNSMNFLVSCLEQPDSFVAQNYVLYNILDSVCSWGYDETCTLDYPAANQATCPNTLGTPTVLTSMPVYNIRYPTGEEVNANANANTVTPTTEPESPSIKLNGSITASMAPSLIVIVMTFGYILRELI